MTSKELQELCKEWQKTLRLQDWNITIKFGIPDQIGGARATIYNNHLEVVITVAEDGYSTQLHNPPNYKEDSAEFNLIHELLEVLFFAIRHEHDLKAEDYRWEQNFNKIANALVKLKQMSLEKK